MVFCVYWQFIFRSNSKFHPVFKVYSSSAGSGKTYTLTKEYLKLALHSNEDLYFKNILAVTFTNAAANEMKERILQMLRQFSAYTPGSGEAPSMLKDIATELYPDSNENPAILSDIILLLSARAKEVFTQILHRYSDFSVMTIDKFTQRLVSSFTDELGLPFVFETQLDRELLDDAVDRLLARIGQEGEEVLTEIVENYYQEKTEAGGSWGALPNIIRESAGALINEEGYLKMQRISNFQMQDWNVIRKQIRALIRKMEDQLTQYAAQGFQLILNEGLEVGDFYYSASGVFGYLNSRKDGKKLWEAPNSYVRKAINDDVWYTAKTPTPIKQQIDSIKQDLADILANIEIIRENQIRKVTLYQELDKHLYNLSLLGEIRKEFDALLKQNNQVHISDFNRRILEIVSQEPIPFIFERLGDKYNHILLDEFQDTSKLQFANLLPLIENALGEGHFNLVVGDAKQSIYRFRGGDMDLILHLSNDQVLELSERLGDGNYVSERLMAVHQNLVLDHLRTNRRSFYEITTFNNDFFSFVAETLADQYPVVAQVFNEYFQQEIPENVKSGGHVQMEFLGGEPENIESESQDSTDPILIRTVTVVEELLEQGYNWKDIAILCRKKKDAAAIASSLRLLGYPLISDDALTLTYSRVVHFVVSFMKVLHNSDHNLARYEAAYLFHHVIRKQNPSAAEYEQIRQLASSSGMDSFLSYFNKWQIDLVAFKLRQVSVFELAEILIDKFGLFRLDSEKEYLFRFLDSVLDYGNKKSNHLGDFLIHWENVKHKLSITVPAGTDALRITTIHKSKGLEYPVVILPYADWSVTPRANDPLWIDLADADYEDLVMSDDAGISKKLLTSIVSYVKALEGTVVGEQYYEHRMRTVVENLNLLYVAFTRPVQALYILAKKDKNWSSGSSVNHWLHDYLNADGREPKWSDEESRYVVHQGAGELFHSHDRLSAAPFYVTQVLSNERSQSLRLRRMADRIFDIDTFEPKNDRLQKLCYLLTSLRTISDLPHLVARLVSDGIVSKKDADDLLPTVTRLLSDDSIGSLYQDNSHVSMNREMLVPGGGMLHVDRMVDMPDGTNVLMRIVAGKNPEEPRRHLRKLIKAFKQVGKVSKGVIITLDNEAVEWV